MKKFEEWDLLGEMGEKLVAQMSKFQELKLALVHREIQRMADDTGTTISWTKEKLDKFRAAWTAAEKAEVESFEFEGEAGLDVLDLLDNTGGAVVPCGPAFGPSGVDIGKGQAPDEVAGQRVAAVGNGIGLHEAGLGDIPVVGADGNLIAQQAARFGGTEAPGASLGTGWGQQSVNSGGTDRQQLVFNFI